MKSFFSNLHGIISLLVLTINTTFWFVPIIIIAIFKLFIPFKFFRKICNRALNWCSINWTSVNNIGIGLSKKINWEISDITGLKRDGWYLVLSNHQSWVDIIILQKIFNRKIPFFRFFLKKELIYVPLLGLAWWALDYPFMKRYSKHLLKKKPHLKGKDIESTKKACSKFSDIPVSIVNYVEGTRYTQEKHAKQKSPYKNLLRPKAGGVGYVLSTLGEQLTSILNITIAYPEGSNFWKFMCGDIRHFKINIEEIKVNEELKGDYINDEKFREWFQKWINNLWHDKDKLIDEMLNK